MQQANVFISYARRDGLEYAERLEAALNQAGIPTWRDKRGLDPWQDFTSQIEDAINEASHVALCLTPDSKRDDSFVRREIQAALLHNSVPLIQADGLEAICDYSSNWAFLLHGFVFLRYGASSEDNFEHRCIHLVTFRLFQIKPHSCTKSRGSFIQRGEGKLSPVVDQKISLQKRLYWHERHLPICVTGGGQRSSWTSVCSAARMLRNLASSFGFVSSSW